MEIELCVAAIEALKPLVVGLTIEAGVDMGQIWKRLTSDSQLRWVGPEKGVIHLATAAVVNAIWDLYARTEGKPLWRLLADMTPEEVVSCVPFTYITDALTPNEALEILKRHATTKQQRIDKLFAEGYPAYTTSAGWLGYSDEKVRTLVRAGIEQGWTHFKMKVGRNLDDDRRRAKIIRDEIGWDRKLMMDANQVWDVCEAIRWMKQLAQFRPHWIEEPTSPDDVLGHARHCSRHRTGWSCYGRALSEPGYVQTIDAGRSNQLLPDR